MILIADCGSTKIDWCLATRNGGDSAAIVNRIFTGGINAVMLTEEEIRLKIADELLPQLGDAASDVEEIYLYGAGCLAEEVCDNVRRALSACLPSAQKIDVHTDLLAAARALCGHSEGIACIMGTGSNSCYYDGKEIAENVSPLGYILGDEGSGAVLGRRLVGDVLKRQLPADLCEKFLSQYQLDRLTIIRRVYREPQANRFLASLSPFLLENIDCPKVRELVLSSFGDFFRRNVMQYPGVDHLPVNFVGSIAWHYRPLLDETARGCGCRVGEVLKSPMDGLLKFHS